MGGEDHTPHADDQAMTGRQRLSVAQAAEVLGISIEAVRGRIKRNTLKHERTPEGVFVFLNADQSPDRMRPGADQSTDQSRPDARDELVENLREQVSYLQGVIETRDRELALRAEEIRRRDSALEREQQLTAFFAERLRELEAPTPDPAPDPEESREEAAQAPESPGPTQTPTAAVGGPQTPRTSNRDADPSPRVQAH